jgi:hypothetical protein
LLPRGGSRLKKRCIINAFPALGIIPTRLSSKNIGCFSAFLGLVFLARSAISLDSMRCYFLSYHILPYLSTAIRAFFPENAIPIFITGASFMIPGDCEQSVCPMNEWICLPSAQA